MTKARSRGQLRPVIPVRQAPVFALLCLLPYATSASDPDPIYLTANDLSIATGKPSLVRMSSVFNAHSSVVLVRWHRWAVCLRRDRTSPELCRSED